MADFENLDETRKTVTNFDAVASLDLIWDALQILREEALPEGNELADARWDDICTAMAWITEELPKPNED